MDTTRVKVTILTSVVTWSTKVYSYETGIRFISSVNGVFQRYQAYPHILRKYLGMALEDPGFQVLEGELAQLLFSGLPGTRGLLALSVA